MHLRRLIVAALLAGVFAVSAAVVASQAVPPRPSAADRIGSSRNARVAIDRTGATTKLVYFARTVPEPEQLRALAEAAPNVTLVGGLSREEATRRAAEAHGADVFYATPEFLRAATSVRWVQATSAGVERFLAIPELAQREEIVFTNHRGVHGPTIADHTMALLLALTRDLPGSLAAQRDGRWLRESSAERVALEGRTMLVVGLGGIGTEIARRAHAFGMRVIATRRSDDPGPAFVERIGKPGELLAMLPEVDVVAIAVPLTAETKGLFGAEAFAAMPRGSYLINIARGGIVETDALLAALREGRLAGAGLDVTDPEPLPEDHPLWKEPRVIITPHVAGDAELTDERAWALVLENLRRFDRGEPLLNVVDVSVGY